MSRYMLITKSTKYSLILTFFFFLQSNIHNKLFLVPGTVLGSLKHRGGNLLYTYAFLAAMSLQSKGFHIAQLTVA